MLVTVALMREMRAITLRAEILTSFTSSVEQLALLPFRRFQHDGRFRQQQETTEVAIHGDRECDWSHSKRSTIDGPRRCQARAPGRLRQCMHDWEENLDLQFKDRSLVRVGIQGVESADGGREE